MNGIKLKIKVSIKFEDKTEKTNYFHLIPFLSTKIRGGTQHISTKDVQFQIVSFFLIQNENLLTKFYISFFLSLGNTVEWWVKRTSTLSRPGQCLILCNSHNVYHNVFAKVVNIRVEWLKKVCVFFFLSYTYTYTHAAGKLILNV